MHTHAVTLQGFTDRVLQSRKGELTGSALDCMLIVDVIISGLELELTVCSNEYCGVCTIAGVCIVGALLEITIWFKL